MQFIPQIPETAVLAAHLRYIGEVSLLLRGPSSGFEYVFTTDLRDRLVDSRDADAMLLSGMFRRF